MTWAGLQGGYYGRIKAVNRKRQDLSSRRFSEDPCARQINGGLRKKHRNKNDEFFGENKDNTRRIKVSKNLLQQRIDPPESAFNIPNFGDQETCLFRHLAPHKIAHRFSYIHLETFKPENFVAIARSLFLFSFSRKYTGRLSSRSQHARSGGASYIRHRRRLC